MPRKLLLADDSVTIQRVIELTFADEDIQVIAVGDGRQAIERLEREPPDIILADVGMPERDGYEVAAFVKSHPSLAQIPVILLTGAFEPIDESRARAVGCDGVLVKPFEPQMVITRVRDLLAGHRSPTPWPAAAAAPDPVRQAADPISPPAGGAPPATDSLEAYFDRLDAAFADSSAAPASAAPARDAATAWQAPAAAPARDAAAAWQAPSGPAPDAATAWPPPSAAPTPDAATPSAPPPSPFDEIEAWDPDLEGDPTPAPPAAVSTPGVAPPVPDAASAGRTASTPAFEALPREAAPSRQASPPITPPSLVEAFAALLTAEQRTPIAPPGMPIAPSIDERTIDEIARRVLSRIEDQSMRPAVLEVAERLVREEIERLKQNR